MPTRVHVVSHTHWDREWYLSFQEYRVRLVRVVEKTLKILDEDPRFKCFMLDGQASILEDYLEAKPEDEQRIRRLVSSGRLKIGPWFTQPDEALVSPEALVRNLLIGCRLSLSFGGLMKVGYLPDTFCHIPQIPQILRGFGIDSFVFTRGMGDEGERLKTQFLYRGPDGSEVIAVHLLMGYCNANMLGVSRPWDAYYWRSPLGWGTIQQGVYEEEPEPDFEAARRRVVSVVNRLKPLSVCGSILLMNGCDHMPPQSSITRIIGFLNEVEKDILAEHSDIESYLEEVRRHASGLQVFKGELRSARFSPTLAGVYSTRVYLKQLNFRAQAELELYAEPLCMFAKIFTGAAYPSGLLTRLWKNLLLNHAHDSIYGSGVDHVHDENEARFVSVIEGASSIVLQAASAVARLVSRPRVDSLAEIVVFNTLNWQRTEPVSVVVPLPLDKYVVHDGDAVVATHVSEPPQDATAWGDACRIEFTANLPPLGYRVYSVVKGEPPECGELRTGDFHVENSLIRVEADPEKGGVLRILEKNTGRVLEGVNFFMDEGDAGDEYNFSPPAEHNPVISSMENPARVETRNLGTRALINISLKMRIPARLEGQRRSVEEVEVPVSTQVSIMPGSRRIDFKTEVDNRAMDHRLRVVFQTDVAAEKSYADYHYQVIERPVEPASKGDNWVENPPTTHPQLTWVDVNDGSKGLTVANRGIPEYEVRKSPKGVSIYLTLVRAVGWLSRSDLSTRRGPAGPGLPTPGAQCLRRMVFEYSVILHEDDWLDSKTFMQARGFAYPPLSIPVLNPKGKLPSSMSLLRVKPESLIVSAVKQWEDGEGLIIRFYNISGEALTGSVEASFQFSEAWKTDLNEQPVMRTENIGNKTWLKVEPREIITLLLKQGRKTAGDK